MGNKKFMYFLLLIIFVGSEAVAGEIFNNPTVGFSIEKPDDWHYLTTDQISENRKNIRMKDEEFKEAVQKYATAPLVAISRYLEPYDDLNTTVQVVFRPLGQLQGTHPIEILKLIVPTVQKVAENFVFIDEIQETKISDIDSAFMKAKYTVSNQENRTFDVISRMMVIPRGAYMFMISMSYKADNADNSEAMLDSILKSIKIEK